MVTTLCAFFWFWGRLDTNGVGAMRLFLVLGTFGYKWCRRYAPFVFLSGVFYKGCRHYCAFFKSLDVAVTNSADAMRLF